MGVCACMCMYVCVYVGMCVCVCECVCVCVYGCVCMSVGVWMCVCVCTNVCMYGCVWVCGWACVYGWVGVCVCVHHVCVCVCAMPLCNVPSVNKNLVLYCLLFVLNYLCAKESYHRQVSTYHGLCYTGWNEKKAQWVHHRTISERSYHGATCINKNIY